MNIKEKDVLSDGSLGGQTSDKTMISTRRKPYEYQLIVNQHYLIILLLPKLKRRYVIV